MHGVSIHIRAIDGGARATILRLHSGLEFDVPLQEEVSCTTSLSYGPRCHILHQASKAGEREGARVPFMSSWRASQDFHS